MTRFASNARKTAPRRRFALRPQAESLEGRQLLSAGDLDLSFSSDGWTTISPVADAKETNDDLRARRGHPGRRQDPGRRDVLSGRVRPDQARGRTASWTPPSGPAAGCCTDSAPGQTYGGMAVQADGKIIVVGGIDNGRPGQPPRLRLQQGHADRAVQRQRLARPHLRARGSRQAERQHLRQRYARRLAEQVRRGSGVAVQADGKIVVSGGRTSGRTTTTPSLCASTPTVRPTPHSAPAAMSSAPTAASFSNVAIQADGKIVVQGDGPGRPSAGSTTTAPRMTARSATRPR